MACGSSHVHMHQEVHPPLPTQADIMFSLRHPNCVQLMGTVTSPPCLVTEYCGRGSLTDCLRVRALLLPGWLCAAALALPALLLAEAACHTRGRAARSIPACQEGCAVPCRPLSANPARRQR